MKKYIVFVLVATCCYLQPSLSSGSAAANSSLKKFTSKKPSTKQSSKRESEVETTKDPEEVKIARVNQLNRRKSNRNIENFINPENIDRDLNSENDDAIKPVIPQNTENLIGSTIKRMMNDIMFVNLKNFFNVSQKTKIIKFSFANIAGKAIQYMLFQLSNLPESFLKAPKNDPFIAMQKQIESLVDQINGYNTKVIYTNPQNMASLIACMRQFLQETSIIPTSLVMSTQLDQLTKLATTCCYLCRNENMIFSSYNAPQEILNYFKPVISKTNQLADVDTTNNIFHIIYDNNGLAQQIIKRWNDFQRTDLNNSKVNRQYAAFLTLLLILENSIVATVVIINQTSHLYKVTNPISVNIDIADQGVTYA